MAEENSNSGTAHIKELARNVFSCKGRIRRRDFIISLLVYPVVAAAIFALPVQSLGLMQLKMALAGIFLLVATLSLIARRLHDRGWVEWWGVLALVPYANIVLLIVLACVDGIPGDNRYGPDPKGRTAAPTA